MICSVNIGNLLRIKKRKDSHDANHEERDTEPTTSARGEVESRSDEKEVEEDKKVERNEEEIDDDEKQQDIGDGAYKHAQQRGGAYRALSPDARSPAVTRSTSKQRRKENHYD